MNAHPDSPDPFADSPESYDPETSQSADAGDDSMVHAQLAGGPSGSAPAGRASAAAANYYAARATSSPPPPTLPPIIIQQAGGGWWKALAWIGWAGLLLCLPLLVGLRTAHHEYYDTTGGIREKYHSLSETAIKKVAVLQVDGPILSGEGYVRQQLERIRRDDDVVGIVLRVNSPGGTVSGSDYIYHHLKEVCAERQLPLTVSMGGIAASGGYYVAMAVGDQENSIFAEPTTTTGSIGVVFPHYDLSGLMETLHIKDDSIVSHPRKRMTSMTRPITEEHREILQSYVDQTFERFREVVLAGRPEFRDRPERLEELATGEIFTAEVAVEHGLVDQIGFIEDAVARVIELAGMDADDIRVVKYDQPLGLLSALQAQASRPAQFPATGLSPGQLEATLLDLSVPRAYYLYTTLPCLVRSGSAVR